MELNEEKYCNCCGKKLDFWDIQEDYSIHRRFGYGSKHDMDKLDIQFCIDCFEKIIENCKISPITEGYC